MSGNLYGKVVVFELPDETLSGSFCRLDCRIPARWCDCNPTNSYRYITCSTNLEKKNRFPSLWCFFRIAVSEYFPNTGRKREIKLGEPNVSYTYKIPLSKETDLTHAVVPDDQVSQMVTTKAQVHKRLNGLACLTKSRAHGASDTKINCLEPFFGLPQSNRLYWSESSARGQMTTQIPPSANLVRPLRWSCGQRRVGRSSPLPPLPRLDSPQLISFASTAASLTAPDTSATSRRTPPLPDPPSRPARFLSHILFLFLSFLLLLWGSITLPYSLLGLIIRPQAMD